MLAGVCSPSVWPAVSRICDELAECAALINFADAAIYGVTTCDRFCAAQGLACVDADDEKANNCRPKKRTADATTCFTVIDATIGSDAICYCGVDSFADQRRQVRIAAAPTGASPGHVAASEVQQLRHLFQYVSRCIYATLRAPCDGLYPVLCSLILIGACDPML